MSSPRTADGEDPFVFVSYARADQDYVTDLIKHLEDVGASCWIDRHTDYGEQWPNIIRDQIDACAALVVVMTPTSEVSDWVSREVIRAQQQTKTILPLLLDGHAFFVLNTTQFEDVADARMPTPSFIKRLQHLTSTAPPSQPTPHIAEHEPTAFQYWYDEGTRLSEQNDHATSLIAYNRVLELDPNDTDAHYNRGNALNKLGRHEEAVTAYDRALELDPNNTLAHTNRRKLLRRHRRLR